MTPQSFRLVMRSGPNPGKVYELKLNEMSIGRDIGNNIVINDPEVSRRHARITAQAGGHVIEDLGSTNGTFVNGQRLVGPHLLRHGELIMLGETIGLAYEALQFDADATLVGGGGVRPAQAPTPETYKVPYAPEPAMTPFTEPALGGEVPPGPVEPSFEPTYEPAVEEKPKSKKGLFIGCGVALFAVICCLVVAAFAFDYANLYCTPLFSQFFNCP